jgi:hypothetical protein
MNRHYMVLLFLLALCVATTCRGAMPGGGFGAGAGKGQPGWRVDLDPLPDIVPRGASILCAFTLTNTSNGELGMGRVPVDMVWLMPGDKLPPGGLHWPPYWEMYREIAPREPVFAPPDKMWHVQAGASLRLSCDLAEQYDLRNAEPGEYRLLFMSGGAIAAQHSFVMVSYRTLQTQDVAGAYQPEPIVLAGLLGVSKASARVSVVEAAGGQEPMQWVMVDKIAMLGKQLDDLPRYVLPTPAGTRVARAEMDNLGQLWVHLERQKESCLVLWRLTDLAWSTLLPWTGKPVVLNTAQAFESVPDFNVVYAGVKDQPGFTTQSVWAMPRVDPAAMPGPATRPATRPAGGP